MQVLTLITFLFTLTSFNGEYMPNKATVLDNTDWNYFDDTYHYIIHFHADGHYSIINSGFTPNNSWNLNDNEVFMVDMDSEELYVGTLYDNDSIVGFAKDDVAEWNFKMYRMK